MPGHACQTSQCFPNSATVQTARRVFPFLSFFYEALRIGGTAAKQKPITLAKWMSIPSLMTLYSLARLGLDEEDKEAILSQMRGKLFGFPVFSALMPFKDAQGRPVQWDLTSVIPYANALGLRLDRSDADKALWQDMVLTVITSNPIGNVAVALGTNEDQFTGRELIVPGMDAGETLATLGTFIGKTALPPLTPGVGTTFSTLNAPERSRGTLQKRDEGQAALRALVGLDLRNAEPSLFRAIEEFQKANGYSERPERFGETAVSRAKGRLFDSLINEDLPGIGRELTYLEGEGITFKDDKAVREWLRSRHPITGSGRIKKDDAETFLESLAPIERQAAERAIEEFDRISEDAGSLLEEAQAKNDGL